MNDFSNVDDRFVIGYECSWQRLAWPSHALVGQLARLNLAGERRTKGVQILSSRLLAWLTQEGL